MGAKNSATSTGNKQAPDNKPMHKCGECESYGSLKNSGKASRADGSRVWERDHIPAKATLFKRAKVLFNTMSADVYECAKGKIESRGMAIVIPRKSHRNFSKTCGSKNTKKQIRQDAKSKESMTAAVNRDTKALQAHLDDTDCGPAYADAVKELKKFDFDQMIRDAVNECK
jgi:hypothetical protein